MPFNVKRGPALIIEKEILRSAAGLDDVLSVVIDATTVNEYEVDAVGTGRWILEAGTLLSKIDSSDKVMPVYDDDSVDASHVVGVLSRTVEFFISADVDATAAANEPVSVFHHGCNFDTSKLIGYTGNETAIKTALSTCLFT